MALLHQSHALMAETISRKSIFIIGTTHKYQRGSTNDNKSKFCRPNEANEFLEVLVAAYEKHSIAGIAEEASKEATEKYKRHYTLPNHVALAFSILHRYCDPNNKQRSELGVVDGNWIKILAANKRNFAECPAEIEQINQTEELELRENDEKREKYWIGELIKFDQWPVLLICGADHVESFKSLASQDGFQVEVLEPDWKPSDNKLNKQG